jgi:GT2 family glycosyltransferase
LSQKTDSSREQGCNPDVSIVIVSWNTRDILRECLQSIIRETRRPYEIIVVDNASSDGSTAMIEAEYPQIVLITNNKNRGFAAATNQGLKVAAGRYLLMLNPDTVILEHAIDKMIVWLNDHPDVGCAGCQVLNADGSIDKTCFSDLSPFRLLLAEVGLHRLNLYPGWDRRSEKDVGVVTGMFMLIPRHILDEVGLMDEAFFVYAEEADLCRRIWGANLRCVFTPVARIIHYGAQSSRQIKQRMYNQQQKSKLIYMRKHYGLLGFLLGKVTYVASSIFRIVAFGSFALLSGQSNARVRASLACSALMFQIFGARAQRIDGP